MGERAGERMQAQRVASEFSRGRSDSGAPPIYRAAAAALVILSAVVFVSFLSGEGQCAVPAYRSLSLYGASMLLNPGLCAVESVVPVWAAAVTGMLFGLSYLLLTRAHRIVPSEDPTGR